MKGFNSRNKDFNTNLKKGSVQISFSFVFMLIIGSFFFVMAYNIVGTYQDNEDLKYSLKLQQTLRNILNNEGRDSGIASGSLKSLENSFGTSIFKDSSVEILCEGNSSLLQINGAVFNNEFLKNFPVFMTKIEEKTKSNSFIAVENFKMPFKITNLIAFVSTKNLIILDKNSEITNSLLNKFKRTGPYTSLSVRVADFENDFTDFTSLKEDIGKFGFSSVVFVSDVNVILDSRFKDFNIYSSRVKVNKSVSGNFGNFIIEDSLGQNSYEYVDFENSNSLITMAVFSKRETFNCGYKKAINLVTPIYGFYLNKTSYFHNLSKNSQICSTLSSNFQQSVKYDDLINSLIELYTLFSSYDGKIYNASEVNTNIEDLNLKHRDLLDFNCLSIY